MGRVLVFGSLNADFVVKIEKFPNPGETVIAQGCQRGPGGKGANQAVSAGRLGAATFMFGKVGKDSNAEMIMNNLTANGVDISFVCCSEMDETGSAFVYLDETGENSIVVIPGANGSFSIDDYSHLDNFIQPDDILVAQLEVPLESVRKVGELAKRKGALFLLNAAPAAVLPDGLLDTVDILVVNETELAALSGKRELETLEQITDAAYSLKKNQQSIIVTLGGQGVLLVSGSQDHMHVPAIEVDVVDTTGAGDAFVGGMAAMLAEGADLRMAVEFANVVGGLATTQIGAQDSIPTREEVFKRLGWESLGNW